ncbi:MAG: hypothetical protein A2474_07715 [Elusimicrobia bacterium RIFOXYC2_FULL_34_12]|nr:MAG: hypothetical protein A2474_07715 [Elusimicrobia bacterium RIFOXYC2_FULL_34_12]
MSHIDEEPSSKGQFDILPSSSITIPAFRPTNATRTKDNKIKLSKIFKKDLIITLFEFITIISLFYNIKTLFIYQ